MGLIGVILELLKAVVPNLWLANPIGVRGKINNGRCFVLLVSNWVSFVTEYVSENFTFVLEIKLKNI
jgi:hypothetical protein